MATRVQPVRVGLAALVLVVAATHVAAIPLAHAGPAGDDFAREPSWAPPAVATVRAEALDWLADRVADDPAGAVLVERGRAVWAAREPAAGFDLLDAVLETLALGEPRLAEDYVVAFQRRDQKIPATLKAVNDYLGTWHLVPARTLSSICQTNPSVIRCRN